MKICQQCKNELPLSEFSKHKRRKDGLQENCKGCVRIYNAQYKKKNKDKLYQKALAYNAANPELVKSWKDKYVKNNHDRVKESKRQWKQRNPDKVLEATQRRSALKKNLTVEKVDYLLIRQNTPTCYLCGKAFTDEEKFNTLLTHIDHKIPLSRTELSPTHSYENCTLTHATCNLQKGDKTPEEYWE